MKVIDGHAHVGDWREPGFAGRTTTLADAARLYGELGFHGALLTTTDRGDNAGLAAALAAHDGAPVFRHAYWVDPKASGGVDALAAALESALPPAALKVHPSFLRRPPTETDFAPFYQLAARHGLPVVVHCGRWREVAGYDLTLKLAEAHPDVSFILSHMGGDEPLLVRATFQAIRTRGIENAYLGTESLRQYWVVREAVVALGPERVVFGSDYNLNHPAAFRAIVDGLGLDDEGRAAVLGGNLNRLLPEDRRF